MSKLVDLTGQKFGRLKVLELVGTYARRSYWLCQCTCGELITARSDHLKSKHIRSCGCLGQEQHQNAGCVPVHKWLRKNKPKPELCERCKERPVMELSYKYSYNDIVSGKLWSRNPDDYEWLCKSCHCFKDLGNKAIMTKARTHRIREFYTTKAATQQELAGLFRVDQGTISNIINHRGAYQYRCQKCQFLPFLG